MNPRQNLLLITAFALAASASTLSAQTLLWSDTTFPLGPTEWKTWGFRGILDNTGEQLTITEDFFGPMQPNNPTATHVPAGHTAPASGRLADGQTLELRANLVSASQSDVFPSLAFNYTIGGQLGYGYMFNKGGDALSLMKFYAGATKFAWFFYTNQPVKHENVTLVLALTRSGTNLNITTRVLDKDNGNAVLFDRTITDTPNADPVLLAYAAGGMIGMADPAETPWPLLMGPTGVQLNLSWGNSLLAPNPRARATFDNAELWQYESPQLTIQSAAVISWPVPQGQFVLESALNLNGSWTPVANPWMRTNNGVCEVSVPRTDSVRFFRLRFAQ
jgi:hypothetical protein